MSTVALVVPCFNEVRRLNICAFGDFISAEPCVRLVLVNDGSTDATLDRCHKIATYAPRQIAVIDLQSRMGKGEAVRVGLKAGIATATQYVGFWDSDLAAPLPAVKRFCDALDSRPEIVAAIGSRSASAKRNWCRAALSRVQLVIARSILRFSTLTDSQCGAKVFRVNAALKAAVERPFLSEWMFDVELLRRLGASECSVEQIPLEMWADIPGSKVGLCAVVTSIWDLLRIARHSY